MDEDEPRHPRTHQIGAVLDALSAGELEARIALLEAEIARLRLAIEARSRTRRDAESIFRL